VLPSEKDVEMLLDLGLTRNEARAYMAITRLRLASVGQISKVSNVRREDIYRILPKLEKMGLIEKLLGKPTKIRAAPVEEALSILIKQEERMARERVSSLKAKTKTFLEHFTRAPRVQVEERVNFALLSKLEGTMSRMLTMIKEAEREIDIVFSRAQIMQLIYTFAEQLKITINKGVRIRIISDVPEYEDSLPRVIEEHISPGNYVDLRYTDLITSHYMLVDFAEALISTATEGNMAENPCIWTNSGSLVGVFQGDFENLWHNSTSWRSIETTAVPQKVINYMEQLRPTNHLIFVYNSPEAKYNVLFNYLKVGLEKDEAGVYVAAEESPKQIREAMKQFGISVKKYEKTGALHICRYEDIYIKDGEFSMATTMNSWNKIYNTALKNGFKGLRVTGETSWFFKRELIPQLIEYEKSLHRVMDIPMIAICAYNINMLNKCKNPLNVYTELARAHGTVLITGLDKQLGRMEIRKL